MNTNTYRRLSPGTEVFIGMDLSRLRWDIAVRAQGETIDSFSCPARREALGPLLDALAHCRMATVYEAGPFGYGLHDWLVSRGVQSRVCSPAQVPVEAHNRVKTDRRDALKLATTLEAGLLRPLCIPTAKQRADRELVRQRFRLTDQRRRAMVQIKSFLLTYDLQPPPPTGARWSQRFVNWLREVSVEEPSLEYTLAALYRAYAEADRQLRDHGRYLKALARSPEYAALVTLLSSVPGIGELTALSFTVEVFDWNRFPSSEAFAAFLGLTPAQYSSGEHIRHGGITRAGNRQLRSLLVEAAWTTIRQDPQLGRHYEDIKRRRGAKRAIVAIARKLSHRLLAMVRTGEVYRLNAA